MVKKKILFYGNCQMEVLAHCLNKSPEILERYELIRAVDKKIESVWESIFTFATWKYRDGCPDFGGVTKEILNTINKSFEEADIIIFQELYSAPHCGRPEEITTRFLYEKYKNKHFIGIPNFWFSGYFMSDKRNGLWFLDLVKLLFDKGLNAKDIYQWFLKGTDFMDEVKTLRETLYENSTNELFERFHDESRHYKNYVNLLYLLYNYEDNLLAYHTNHPSTLYFKKLYESILFELDSSLSFEIEESSIIPVGSNCPYVGKFRFFKELFPNIKNMKFHKQFFHHDSKFDIKLIQNHIDEISKDEGE